MVGLRSGHIDMGVDHTVSGNPMRFDTGRSHHQRGHLVA